MRSFAQTQAGRLVDSGNEKPQRISLVNRSGVRLCFGAGVTFAPDSGCTPPLLPTDRIVGFSVQVVPEDFAYGFEWMSASVFMDWVPQEPFYFPGDIVCVTRNDRIKAIAPYDVRPGDPVYVTLNTGMPAAAGVLAEGCTWQSDTKLGELAVIQVNTRLRR